MANFEIPEKPEYSEEIRKFEEEDPGHADLFNAVVETLLNNEVFLKKLADSLAKSISGLNTLTKYTTVQTPNPSMGAQIVQKENTELDMETGLPFPFPIQEVVAGHELALRQLNTDMLPTYQVYDCGFTMCRIGHIRIICSDYIDADAVRNTILDYRDRPATFTVVPVAICTGGWGTIFGDAGFHTNGKITIAASASVGGAMGSYTDVTKLAFNTVFTAK